MMGIYVHIPFCRSKCFYCGFYSVASTQLRGQYVDALCREIELRREYLSTTDAGTLYFGGGTPSMLEIGELGQIVGKLEGIYRFCGTEERTIEANPEDVTPDKLRGWRSLGFNRLSVGVQSFNDEILKRINRKHSGQRAREAIEMAAAAGFKNIGADFIIGLPGYEMKDFDMDFSIIKELPIKHISIYILSIDSNSVFEKLVQKGTFQPEDDDELADRYLRIVECLKSIGFEHYEISNFAREGYYSIHNTSYWQQKEYIGLGPSAHSYNLHSRQWNTSHIKNYINSLNNNVLSFDIEKLSDIDKYNEYVMTNLRTMWGIRLGDLLTHHPSFYDKFLVGTGKYLDSGHAVLTDGNIRLTENGWLISDLIFSDLFA